MLEALYATGLRVSELVSLPMSALHLTEGWIKVRGKGGKERLIPLGEQAVMCIRTYLGGAREELMQGGRSHAGVRQRPGPWHDPARFLEAPAQLCPAGWHYQAPVAAYATPFLRDPSAGAGG